MRTLSALALLVLSGTSACPSREQVPAAGTSVAIERPVRAPSHDPAHAATRADDNQGARAAPLRPSESQRAQAALAPALESDAAQVAAAPEPAKAQPLVLCDPHAVGYFACRTSGGKAIELCATRDDKVSYYFGRPQHVELRYPRNDADPPLRFAHYGRADTERYEVTFESGGASYSVFDYIEGQERTSGVRVTLASGREIVIRCAALAIDRLEALESRLPCDADNALNLGGCSE